MLYIAAVDVPFLKMGFPEQSSGGISPLGFHVIVTNLRVKCMGLKCSSAEPMVNLLHFFTQLPKTIVGLQNKICLGKRIAGSGVLNCLWCD